jgi:predicted HTH transcriptional regulator
MCVGAIVGLLMAFVSGFILRKVNKINSLYDELSQDIELIISHGEGPKIEFKSSFRWDIKENRANKSLESVVLKTIAGFMNSDGGSLLIGIADDGEILGLDPDYSLLKRQDSDGFEQAIMTVISTQLGTDLCQYVSILFHQLNNKNICRLFIKKSQRPVYFNQKGSPKFYLRTGGGTRDMNIQEATEYIKRRWS